jgi:hypothetical protein
VAKTAGEMRILESQSRVIYVPDPKPGGLFVITAYELDGKPLKAYRRRIGKK